MAFTCDYARLAARSPKALGLRPRKPRIPVYTKLRFDDLSPAQAAHLSTLPVPTGNKRYYLRVPREKFDQAQKSGCQWDQSIARWFIDNPKFLSDFANWKPALSARADTPQGKAPQAPAADEAPQGETGLNHPPV